MLSDEQINQLEKLYRRKASGAMPLELIAHIREQGEIIGLLEGRVAVRDHSIECYSIQEGRLDKTIADLRAQVESLKAAVSEARRTLMLYADRSNWIEGISEEGTTVCDDDCGEKARKWLAENP